MTAATVVALLATALEEAGLSYRINTAGNLFSVFFVDADVVDFETAKHSSVARYAAFFHAMLDHGVYLPPSAFEAWFVGASHDSAALDRLAAALPFAARAAAAANDEGHR
jgi:glutamate-1-semialdehyde 2,1-aminomutase